MNGPTLRLRALIHSRIPSTTVFDRRSLRGPLGQPDARQLYTTWKQPLIILLARRNLGDGKSLELVWPFVWSESY